LRKSCRPESARIRIDPRFLPRLAADSSIDAFIDIFESQLSIVGVPEEEWKIQLIGQLDECHKLRVSKIMADRESTYEDLIQALRQASGETSQSAGQRYHAAEPDSSRFKDTATALKVTRQWLERINDGLSKKEAFDALARARVRSWHSDSLRIFAEDQAIDTDAELLAVVANWKSKTHDEISEFPTPRPKRGALGAGGTMVKKQVTCFQCGKVGHYAKDCRGANRSSDNSSSYTNTGKTLAEETVKGKAGGRVIKCYECGGEGHVHSECPTANKKTKAVKTRIARVLDSNEVLAKVGGVTRGDGVCSEIHRIDSGTISSLG